MDHRKLPDTSSALLDHEFAQERASALGRLGRTLEAALATLAAFDASQATTGTSDRTLRADLVAQASVALWQFVVQREACGLHDMRAVMRDYRVPAEVTARMGVLPEWPARRRR